MTETHALIEKHLDQARVDGHFSPTGMYRGMTAEHVAEDICAFCDDLETVSPHEATPNIAAWMARQ